MAGWVGAVVVAAKLLVSNLVSHNGYPEVFRSLPQSLEASRGYDRNSFSTDHS
jgi:hypothetical protein